MSMTQYCLSWDSHKNNVCNGFTNLQQNDEFVDMTLAADGHLVNVHKSIFALASPYIKTILQSIPNKYPVVFLNNISHEILNYILTYVYTGEVSVEVDKIKSFMKAAKDLHISGLSSMAAPKVGPDKSESINILENRTINSNVVPNSVTETENDEAMVLDNVSTTPGRVTNSVQLNTVATGEQTVLNGSNLYNVDPVQNAGPSDVPLYTDSIVNEPVAYEQSLDNIENSGLFTTTDGYQYRLEIPNVYNSDYNTNVNEEVPCNLPELPQIPNTDNVFNSIVINNDKSITIECNATKNEIPSTLLPVTNENGLGGTSSNTISSLDPKALTPQYTMSSRGALQLILNRYMYYCHHKSHGGRKRRWRCIDYRRRQCPAFIDTDCDIMTIRKFIHSHSYHDDQIIKKTRKNMVFTNLNNAIQKFSNSKQ
ncbi:uncharacterized protein [Epargyreus clarus]|uniref:uncharacterized protein isoform X2 n=1 Tax=Epargyreus clarus TaxID=520877 RepID=UPI003C2BD43A